MKSQRDNRLFGPAWLVWIVRKLGLTDHCPTCDRLMWSTGTITCSDECAINFANGVLRATVSQSGGQKE